MARAPRTTRTTPRLPLTALTYRTNGCGEDIRGPLTVPPLLRMGVDDCELLGDDLVLFAYVVDVAGRHCAAVTMELMLTTDETLPDDNPDGLRATRDRAEAVLAHAPPVFAEAGVAVTATCLDTSCSDRLVVLVLLDAEAVAARFGTNYAAWRACVVRALTVPA